MRSTLEPIPNYLFVASTCGLALFTPFSISGQSISIMLGFLGVIINFLIGKNRFGGVKSDPMLLASILLVVFAFPSVLLSENMARAFRDWRSYWQLLVYFLIAYNISSMRLRRISFWILFASLSLSSIVAFVQWRGGLNVLLFEIGSQEYRPSSTMFTMTFAGILYQLITTNFSMAMKRWPRTRTNLLLLGGVLLQTGALLLTLTRGAWLALFAGMLSVTVLLKRRGTLIIAVGILIATGALSLQNEKVRHRVYTMFSSDHASADSNISTRFALWKTSWHLFKKHPLLGVGMGDYTIEAEKLLAEGEVNTTIDSHNIYLQLLATRGLVGFVPFVFFWVTVFRMLFRVKRTVAADPFARHFVIGVIAVAAAVLVGALSENNLDDSEVFTTFVYLLGLAKSFGRSAEQA